MSAAAARDLEQALVRLGDDALITAQRLCEWSGRAPTLEEDLALSNVGLDYLGRARLCYAYAGTFSGKTEDDYAFLRSDREYSNLLIVELPRGDFAFTLVRQYLVDEFETLYFAQLCRSSDSELRGIAEKAVREVAYHLRRSREWMMRFGLGTDESRDRAVAALDELWGYTGELFDQDELEQRLIGANVLPDRSALHAAWHQAVCATLEAASLKPPAHDWQVSGGREGVHTEHLGHLLTEMQFMQRAYPDQQW